MALDDPNAPAPIAPWSWVPPEWLQPAPAQPVMPAPAPVQAAPMPAPVEMATPTLPPPGEPAPVEMPEIEMPPDYVGQPPMPEQPAQFDALSPSTWAPQEPALAPVGHMRTEAAPGEQSLSVEERARLSATDPAAYAKLQIDESEDQAAQARAGMARLARQEAQDAEDSVRVFRESQANTQRMMQQVEADVNALANEKPKKFTDSLGNVLGSIAGIILGAYGQSASGGRNMGVEGMNAAMDRFANEQTAEYNRKAGNVDRRMNLIAKLRDAGYNDYQSREVIRLAGYERAKQMMLTDIQDYDPQGTTARLKMQRYAEFDAAQKQAAEKLRQQQLDEAIKVGEFEIKARKAADEHAAAQRKLGAGAGGAGAGPAKPGNITGQQLTEMVAKAGGSEVFPDKPGGYSTSEARGHVDLAGKVTEEGRKTRTRFVEGITDASGNAFEFASEKEGQAFREKKAAIADLNALIGDVVRDIDEKGGTVGFVNSGLNKRYKSRLSTIDMRLKNAFQTGSLDEGALKVMGQLKGGDVTSMITGGTEGLDTLRDDLVRSFNMDLRAQPGYNGPGYDPPYKPRLPKAGAGPDGERLQQTIKASYLPAATLDKVRTGKAGPALEELDPLGAKENVDVHLEQLEKAARVNDDAGRDAKETLQVISTKAVNADVKKRAAEILKTIPKPRMSGPIGGDGGAR